MTIRSTDKKTNDGVIHRARKFAARHGIRVAISVFVVLLVLGQLGLITSLTFSYGFIVALLYILSEQMHEMQSNANPSTTAVDLQLLDLSECVADLEAKLCEIRPRQKVTLEHFALDGTFAWESFQRLFVERENLYTTDYRLLLITGDSRLLSNVDDEVLSWSSNVKVRMEKKIRTDLQKLQADWSARNRKLEWQIRFYSAAPNIHGFRIRQPFQVTYVAICRWNRDDPACYDWGGRQYHRIVGGGVSAVDKDLLAIFEGNFEHFWEEGKTGELR